MEGRSCHFIIVEIVMYVKIKTFRVGSQAWRFEGSVNQQLADFDTNTIDDLFKDRQSSNKRLFVKRGGVEERILNENRRLFIYRNVTHLSKVE